MSTYVSTYLIAPAGRPRGLPRRRSIISCACICVCVCVRSIVRQYAGEHGRKNTGKEISLFRAESAKVVLPSNYDA